MPANADTGSLAWKLTPDLLGVADDRGLLFDTNPAWFDVLGRTPEDIESRVFLDFVHPEDLDASRRSFDELLAGRPVFKMRNRYRHADGSYRWISWNAIPDGGLFFCSGRDVTDEQEQAAALRTSDAALLTSDAALLTSDAALRSSSEEARLREQFIAVLGHDMRNPVAAVGSALRLISREPQSERSQAFIETARQSLDRMSALIEDVMDFARARLGEGLAVEPTDDTHLLPVLRQVVEEIRLGHPTVRVEEDYTLDAILRCDTARIGQLLSNLLANAVTHGDPGQPIHVTAALEDGAFVLSVVNAGDPIPDDARPMLFQPFTRSDARHSQNGLGLGLFIASEIARGHDGGIDVTSNTARTTFTLRMPAVVVD